VAGEGDGPGAGPVQAAEDLQQRGLAVPGPALDRQPLAVADDQVQAAECAKESYSVLRSRI
jgi:hypothetical protein